jgi:hypothetical protein
VHAFLLLENLLFDIGSKSRTKPLSLMQRVFGQVVYLNTWLQPMIGLNFDKIGSTRIHQGSLAFTQIKNNSHNFSDFSYVCPVLTFIKFRSAKPGSWTLCFEVTKSRF